MSVDDWVSDAVERMGISGASLRDVQRSIDERHLEELSVDVIAGALARLERRGRLRALDGERWGLVRRSGTAAFDALFTTPSPPSDTTHEEEST